MTELHASNAMQISMLRIRDILATSPVPEDPGHAENTLQWLLRLAPNADDALRLAALAHDIERARPSRLRREQFDDYDAFKAQHAETGARIASEILTESGIEPALRIEVCRLISRHEIGGDPRSDLLKDADSLSYFDHNLPLYFAREGWEETLRRARWGYQRLSMRARDHYDDIRHENPALQRLIAEARCLKHTKGGFIKTQT
ncbi:MAG TPA: DUF4202 family protein [Eoetvoesiella sp.]